MKADALARDRSDVSRALFDRIAARYDLTNRVLSFGMDESWRRQVVKNLPDRGGLAVLDVATGTGDLAFALARDDRVDDVLGVDLSEQMLAVAADKNDHNHVRFAVGDAMDLGFEQTFDVVTIAFGIRNVIVPPTALASMHRALKPGGRLMVLEFGEVHAPLRPFYDLYRKRLLPVLGGMLTNEREAYRYLDETIATFPSGQPFLAWMRDAGFSSVSQRHLAFGGVRLYRGDKA